MTLNYPGSLTK